MMGSRVRRVCIICICMCLVEGRWGGLLGSVDYDHDMERDGDDVVILGSIDKNTVSNSFEYYV